MPRPLKPIISQESAARAALAVVDAHGLEGFSLARVADQLGVKAPSLYHHFSGKDELLAAAARLLIINSPMPSHIQPGIDWREAVVTVSVASWRSILSHPRAAPLLLQFFPLHLMIDAYERWVKLLAVNGVPPEWQVWILEGSEKLTFGSALFAAASHSRGTPPYPSYSVERHPYLANAINANTHDEEGVFVAALRSFLNGVPDFDPAKPQPAADLAKARS